MNTEPGLSQLLKRAGDGDKASFAALYDATIAHVNAMATTLFANAQHARSAVINIYHALWVQSPHFTFDFDTEVADEKARNRTVDAWIDQVAQQSLVDSLATSPQTGRDSEAISAVTEKLPELRSLSIPQRDAVGLGWLGARNLQQISTELGMGIGTLKSRLRDACSRLVSAHEAALSGADTENDPVYKPVVTPQSAARTGHAAKFSTDIADDLESGLGQELAGLCALNVLDEADTVTINSWVNRQDKEFRAAWKQRQAILSRSISWAFQRLAREPQESVLEEILETMPEQNTGVDLINEFEEVESTPQASRALKRNIFIGIAVVMVIAIAVAVFVLRPDSARSVESRVNDAGDTITPSPVSLVDGGTGQAHVSAEEDAGYFSFSGVPKASEGNSYQLWLFEDAGATPVSAGTYTAEELMDNQAQFSDVADYSLAWLTVEPESGSESPTSEPQGEFPLDN